MATTHELNLRGGGDTQKQKGGKQPPNRLQQKAAIGPEIRKPALSDSYDDIQQAITSLLLSLVPI